MLVTKALSRLIFRYTITKSNIPNTSHQQEQFYEEQPLAGDTFVNESIKRIYKSNKKEVLEFMNLMDAKIVHRNHTIINEACFRLLDFQKQMTKDEIIKMLQLCIKSRVYNPAFVQHFENQLFHKLQPVVKKLIQEHYKIKEVQSQKLWKQIQKNSHDIFQVLNDPEALKQSQTQKEQDEEANISQKQIALPEMSKQKLAYIAATIKQFGYIGFLLTQLQVQSTNLLKLFKQLFLVLGNSKNMTWQILVQYTRITNHICSKTEEQYQRHKQYYLKRTLKKIKQYQLIFYQRMLPMMTTILPKLTSNQLQSVYSQISKYKIKSNGPQTYLLQMYKDYSLKVIKGEDSRLLDSISSIISQKPKLLQKLKQFDNKLLELEQNKQLTQNQHNKQQQ